MHESLKLFDSICNIKSFAKASMLLVLNKRDVFDETDLYSPLSRCFKEYTGAEDKYEASSYILNQFGKQNKSGTALNMHFTCAKDSENVHILFNVVYDTIVHSNMPKVGLE